MHESLDQKQFVGRENKLYKEISHAMFSSRHYIN